MPRGQFDGLRLDLADGDRVHAYGRPELFEAKGEFRLRALSLERFGLGDHLAALERLKKKLAAEGLFAAERKRPLPLLPRRIGLVTGNDAAAKRDVLTVVTTRFPPANVLVAETYVQGPRAAGAVVEALARTVPRGRRRRRDRARRRELRGPAAVQRRTARARDRLVPGSRRDARSATSRTRRSATSPPTCAPRRRASPGAWSSPTSTQLLERLDRSRAGLERGARRSLDRERQRLDRAHERLRRAPRLLVERGRAKLEQTAGRLRTLSPQATLERGYAIVRAKDAIVRSAGGLETGERVEVELAEGGFGARVEETR